MEERPVHESATSTVTFAVDHKAAEGEPTQVALKCVANEDEYEREWRARAAAELDPERVVAVLRRHDEIARGERVMCLALPRADRNLLDAIQNERIAGTNKVQVMAIVRDIALALKEMHDHHLVHGDVKV